LLLFNSDQQNDIKFCKQKDHHKSMKSIHPKQIASAHKKRKPRNDVYL